jgi:hypothetical protein
MTSSSTKGYLAKVVVEDGQTVMLLSDDLLKALALRPNEILEWFVDDRNNEVLIKRHKIIDNKTV